MQRRWTSFETIDTHTHAHKCTRCFFTYDRLLKLHHQDKAIEDSKYRMVSRRGTAEWPSFGQRTT